MWDAGRCNEGTHPAATGRKKPAAKATASDAKRGMEIVKETKAVAKKGAKKKSA